ncbi:MAG: enoyl-CoA hydratase-related protein, partial [Pseudomonadota bacterium]
MGVLETERRGPAVWLWLNRPEVRNALNEEVQISLCGELQKTRTDKSVRVVVLAARGAAFSAGGDLARMQQAARMPKGRNVREARRFADLLYRMHRYPKPIVARVHGAAFAGGMGLACACDLVIAAEEAEF